MIKPVPTKTAAKLADPETSFELAMGEFTSDSDSVANASLDSDSAANALLDSDSFFRSGAAFSAAALLAGF